MNSKNNKIKINSFDTLVEKLMEGFSKIPNFELTKKDELANTLFNVVSYKIADIISYKDLVVKHYIPATNKAIFTSKEEIRNSRYRYLLDLKTIDFNESLYETIRLSYVGLFHKLENYTNDVQGMTEKLFPEKDQSGKSLNTWAKEKFDFQLKDWQQFTIVHKINWIANCVKHRDGYPTKEPKPKGYELVNENEKIKIDVKEFEDDCKLLLSFFPIYLQIMFFLAQHKMFTEDLDKKLEQDYEFYQNELKHLQKLGYSLNFLIEQMKKI